MTAITQDVAGAGDTERLARGVGPRGLGPVARMWATSEEIDGRAAEVDPPVPPESPAEVAAEPGEAEASPPQRASIPRSAVWREVLGTPWLALPLGLAALGAARLHYRWEIAGVDALGDGRLSWTLSVVVLLTLLAATLEGAHRAVARRQRDVEARRREIERLVRIPQRRLVEAKYQLYRDAFLCTQLVGFLMMSRMEASAMTPETALGIERSWGDAFLGRFRRMFGTGPFGDLFSNRIGATFPPPRDRAIEIYVGLAEFLRLMAERITERDLDPAYLHGLSDEPAASAPELLQPVM